jgi:N-acetylglucosaminyl-diphospho-decaprenol L-rhamnosyltransferase
MISLLVVNYRSALLAIRAITSARAAGTKPLQVVVVDNSCDAAEAGVLRPHADVLIVSDRNRGYAGAINDGRRACDGDTIVITNPDVTFMPGAIDALTAVLDERTAVAGPSLFWDDECRWFLPPAGLHTGRDVLAAALASRSRRLSELRDRRRIRKRIAFWSLRETTEVKAISGAVMAVNAAVFDAVGGFDKRFFLYFEENDFLRRVSEIRRRIVYVPRARCRHLYNQSAGLSSDAPALYASSERRYLEKWNGPFVAQVLERLRRAPIVPPARDHVGPIELPDCDVVVEASPLPSFDTAAGHFPDASSVDLPPEVRRAYRGEAVYLRVVRRDTAEVLGIYRRRAGD